MSTGVSNGTKLVANIASVLAALEPGRVAVMRAGERRQAAISATEPGLVLTLSQMRPVAATEAARAFLEAAGWPTAVEVDVWPLTTQHGAPDSSTTTTEIGA